MALDIFNLFNSNTPDVYQTNDSAPSATSTSLNPTSITVGRFFKISAQLDSNVTNRGDAEAGGAEEQGVQHLRVSATPRSSERA